jgi:hypothetical protein
MWLLLEWSDHTTVQSYWEKWNVIPFRGLLMKFCNEMRSFIRFMEHIGTWQIELIIVSFGATRALNDTLSVVGWQHCDQSKLKFQINKKRKEAANVRKRETTPHKIISITMRLTCNYNTDQSQNFWCSFHVKYTIHTHGVSFSWDQRMCF